MNDEIKTVWFSVFGVFYLLPSLICYLNDSLIANWPHGVFIAFLVLDCFLTIVLFIKIKEK